VALEATEHLDNVVFAQSYELAEISATPKIHRDQLKNFQHLIGNLHPVIVTINIDAIEGFGQYRMCVTEPVLRYEVGHAKAQIAEFLHAECSQLDGQHQRSIRAWLAGDSIRKVMWRIKKRNDSDAFSFWTCFDD
jgi:hypothetical protein